MTAHKDFKIAIVGTCDTKLEELLYLCDYISALSKSSDTSPFSITPVLINTGKPSQSSNHPKIAISIHSLLSASNKYTTRNDLITAIGGALKSYLLELERNNEVHGVLAVGGSCGSSIASNTLQSLSFGFPKILLSTMASGDIKPYVGCSDTSVLYSVVDIAGLNSILKQVLQNAAGAIVGMVRAQNSLRIADSSSTKNKKVAITMFGITTPACNAAREFLERSGCEVYVFHATGSGGMAMEKLILEGTFEGVLDLTTTELADEAFGGILSAGSERLKGGAKMGIPMVVSTGALDCINFGPMESLPEKYQKRKIYVHNSSVTVIRTTADENKRLGEIICTRLIENSTRGKNQKVEVWLPLRSTSMIDQTEPSFRDEEANKALHDSIIDGLSGTEVDVVKKDLNINDKGFAEGAAAALLRLMALE
ncbi:hypothetical protein TWF730_002745 [Orbilia blumenaviensis]|uniref:Uncharacterized protein n=1 Tax=Orbilia blumenaviensis TaxID=1796055 RepID=A0AAV9U9Z8_9PEZI